MDILVRQHQKEDEAIRTVLKGYGGDIIDRLSPLEQKLVCDILRSVKETGQFDMLKEVWQVDYLRQPPDIIKFLEDPEYYGHVGGSMYPKWKEALVEGMDPTNNIWEFIFRGCLAGSTLIPLLDGTTRPMKDIVHDFLVNGKRDQWVLAWNRDRKRWEPDLITDAVPKGVKKTWRITLDNGKSVECTSDHKFLTRGNQWKSVDTGLKVGASMMPYNSQVSPTGYVQVKTPGSSSWTNRYRVVADWKNTPSKGQHVHHKNFRKTDDRPSNLCVVQEEAHMDYHRKLGGRRLLEWRERIGEDAYAAIMKVRSEKAAEAFRNMPDYLILEEDRKRGLRRITKDSAEQSRKSRRLHEVHPHLRENARAMSAVYNTSEQGRAESVNRAEHMRKLFASKTEEEKALSALKRGIGGLRRTNVDGCNDAKLAERIAEIRKYEPDYVPTSLSGASEAKKLKSKLAGLRVRNPDGRNDAKILALGERIKALDPAYVVAPIVHTSDAAMTVLNLKDALAQLRKNNRGGHNDDKILAKLDEIRALDPDFNHAIVSIEYVGEQMTYDFTVERNHCYALDCEIVASNCIGSGKSWVAATCVAYELCVLLHMRAPQQTLKLGSKSDPIFLGLISTDKGQVKKGLWPYALGAMKLSPFFTQMANLKMEQEYLTDLTVPFPNNIKLIGGSLPAHIIGSNLYCLAMDEVNYRRGADGQKAAYEFYTKAKNRIENRFRTSTNKGRLILISSETEQASFLDEHCKKQLTLEHKTGQREMLVCQFAEWDVKPHETLGITPETEWFEIDAGDNLRPPKILEPGEIPRAGARLVKAPKIETYWKSANRDLLEFIKERAGITPGRANKWFYNVDALMKTFVVDPPTLSDLVELAVDTPYDASDSVEESSLIRRVLGRPEPKFLPNAPRFIHVDLARTDDKAGFAMSHICDYAQGGSPIIKVELAVGFKASKLKPIDFDKIIDFVKWLRSVGFNIRLVTYDSWQSYSSQTTLEKLGFEVKTRSVDVMKQTPHGKVQQEYSQFRKLVHEGRVLLPNMPYLKKEALDLENQNSKPDHPAEGSKDIMDACVGSAMNALDTFSDLREGDNLDYQILQEEGTEKPTPKQMLEKEARIADRPEDRDDLLLS